MLALLLLCSHNLLYLGHLSIQLSEEMRGVCGLILLSLLVIYLNYCTDEPFVLGGRSWVYSVSVVCCTD